MSKALKRKAAAAMAFERDPKMFKSNLEVDLSMFLFFIIFYFEDDFPTNLDETSIPIKLSKKYILQDWTKIQETREFIEVYLWNCLEEAVIWNSYYSNGNEHFYKCGDKKCTARLKILVENEENEEMDHRPQKNKEKVFSAMNLKKAFEIKVPKITVFSGEKHSNHGTDYKEKASKRLSGKI